MYIKQFQVQNFKVFKDLKEDFHPRRNFILGANGLGKTSLLEALHTLMSAYSFSRQGDKELVQIKEEFYTLSGNLLQNDNVEYDLFVSYQKKESKKKYLLDGKKVPQYKTLLEKFPVVFFTPFDIQNILGEPQYRRLFFDRMLSYLNPHYYRLLKEYQKIVKEKNLFLKTKDYILLEAWNERMIEIASQIITERLKYLDKFIQMNQTLTMQKPSFIEHLNWEYKGCKTKEDLQKEMKDKFYKEKERQVTLWGPHRDDYLMVETKKNKRIKDIFSLGQIKWSSFYLKMMEVLLMNQHLQSTPIFLIDDAFSELDKENQHFIIQFIENLPNQIFSTSTHIDLFKDSKQEGKIFTFKDIGNINKESHKFN